MANINTPGPCANPGCLLGGIAPSTHKCPDCGKNIHAPCGDETPDSIHFVLCPVCKAKRIAGTGQQGEREVTANQQQHEQAVVVPPQQNPRPAARAGAAARSKPPKRSLPPPSDCYNGTSMATRLSQPSCILAYHDYLAEFMSFRDGKKYVSPYPFPNSELQKVTPKEVASFLAMKAYGKPDPTEADNPTVGRSNSILYYKKAISFFMPNRLMAWNFAVGWGNPTRSNEVNELIKAVMKKEAAGFGKASQARRDFDKDEFDQVMNYLGRQSAVDLKLGVPCLFKFSYHFIARLDDACKLRKAMLRQNVRVPDSLVAKLQWSKNVNTEKPCPWQIIFGCKDASYCLLLALALHLETTIAQHGGNKEFIFHFGKLTPEQANSFVSSSLRKILNTEFIELMDSADGKLGTHSNRKYGATAARRRGGTPANVDFRARWGQNKRQQDRYTNADLPWPDGDIAARLCVGGPIRYAVKAGSGITTDWIIANVVPNIAADGFHREVARVLGTALLWAAFEESMAEMIPLGILQRIHSAYEANKLVLQGNLHDNENPVSRILLDVYETEGVLQVMDLDGGDGGTNNTDQPMRNIEDQRGELRKLRCEVHELKVYLAALKAQQDQTKSEWTANFNKVFRHLNRIESQPGRRVRVAGDNGEAVHEDHQLPENNARLSRCPKTLHLLWDEWTNGLGGNKAARSFTARERGRVRYVFSKRKVFWDQVSLMVRSGELATVAIDKIYDVYGGDTCVTKILRQMQKDKATGGHPSLRIVSMVTV